MTGTVLELRNVSVVKNGKQILDSIDLSVDHGENIAILGPNGSGKSTLIKLITGQFLPYYDESDPAVIRLFGMERWNLFDLRSRMGIVSMDLQNGFDPSTAVIEVICSGFFSSMDVYRDKEFTEDMLDKARRVAYTLGIEGILDRSIDVISLGEMRRALIARALVNDPEILILDEPMTGLDIVMKTKFREMFDILSKNGVNIVMVTHDLLDIPGSVSRVVAIKNGKVLKDGKKEEVLIDPIVSELYGQSIKVIKDNGLYQMVLAGGSEL